MAIINNSYLLGLYGLGTGTSTTATTSTSASTVKKKTDPTPPWDVSSTAPRANDLIKRAMAGRSFIDLNSAQLDVKGASQDYRKLFALYQGLNTLYGLTERMDAKGVSSLEKLAIERRFNSGLDQVADFVDRLKLDKIGMATGTVSSLVKSGVGMSRPSTDDVGAVIHQGSSTSEVAAFQGDVSFSMKVQKTTTLSNGTVINVGSPTDVNIDLADMGSTPRTLGNVVTFVNDRLATAGVQTRLATERTAGTPQTITVGGKEVTLGTAPDRFALKIKGSLGESVTLSTTNRADAVYVVQQSNTGDAATQQLLKFQSDVVASGTPEAASARPRETYWVDGRAFQVDMASAVDTARAVATGPDGSVYVLADVDGDITGQTIKGDRDVALLKYDSAGRLVFARTLGAAETASGYALSVAADGRVAVAGSVTGALDRGDDGLDGKTSDSFVTVFDANGDEMWTQRRVAMGQDEALAVSFGADGQVFVSGRTKATAASSWDSYLQGFGPPTTTSPYGVSKFNMTFGTGGEDRATAMTMDGDNVLVAGIEDGRAVVRRYSLNPTGQPTLVSTRDLGEIQGGEITGIAVQDGRVVVTGTTGNAALSGATVTRAHAGGTDAFVAALETDLGASAADRMTFYGTAGADKATAAAFSGGSVWITGHSPSSLPAVTTGDTSAGTIRNTEGFIARINPLTGAIEYEQTFNGAGNTAAPKAIAVAQGGASALDRLGLPQGTIATADSARIVAGTSVRAGDKFFVEGRLGRKAVTIEANDTLATLARKIERASGFTVKATVVKDVLREAKEDEPESATLYGALERLQLKPADGRSEVKITAGDLGIDALRAIGLEDSVVRAEATTSDGGKLYGLELSRHLRIDSKEGIKQALDALSAALTVVRDAYRDLVALGKPQTKAVTGPVPTHLTNQIANYQAALDRLGG